MHSSLTPEYGVCLEPVVVVAVGAAVVVGLAAIAGRWVRSAAWQRTIWQATTVGLLALLVVELTGSGSAFVQLVRAKAGPTDAATRPAAESPAARPSPPSAPETAPAAPEASFDDAPVARQVLPRALVGTGMSPVRSPNHGQDARATHKTLVGRPPAPGVLARTATMAAAPSRLSDEPPPATASVPFAPPDVVEPQAEVGEAAPAGVLTDGLAVAAFMRPGSAASEPLSAEPSWATPSDPMNRVTTSRPPPSPVTTSPDAMGQPAPTRIAASRDTTRRPLGDGAPSAAAGAWWAVIWALGAVVIAGRFAWARLRLAAFRRRHTVVRDGGLCRRVAALARRQGIRRPVVVLESAGLTAPVAFGIIRPTLALPTTFCGEFSPAQQEAMLAHELAHLAGGDPGWQLVADWVCAALWWHPLGWWSRRRLCEAGEAAADEASLLVPDGPNLLASSLLVLGQRLAGAHARLGWLSARGPGFRSGLGRRVERLLRLSGRPPHAPGRARLALARTSLPVALVIVALLATAWAHSQVALGEGGTTMSVLSSSWRRSLAAAAVAAVLMPISGDVMSQEEGDRPAAARRERREGGGRPGGEREFFRHQIEVLRLAMHALREAERGDAMELVERAIRAREVMLEGRRDDEAHEIREHAPPPPELAEILGMAVDLWREFDQPEKAEEVARLAEALRAPRDRERGRARERGERESREGRRREPREFMPALQRELDELSERARHIKGRLGELRDGQEEEARALQGELTDIRARMEQVEGEMAEGRRHRPRRAQGERDIAERERQMAERRRDELARHADELMEAHERALREDRPREAERLLREAEEIRRDLERLADRERPEGPPPEEREEMERRMHHVRVAIENLHAAGLHEQAEHLAREMEHLLHGRPEPPGPEPRACDGPPHAERLEAVLRELDGAIGQLDERMEAMSAQMEGEIREIHHGVEGFAAKVEGEIREIRQQMENMGREVEARTREFEELADDMAAEMEEMEEELDEMMDRDDDEEDDDEEEEMEEDEE